MTAQAEVAQHQTSHRPHTDPVEGGVRGATSPVAGRAGEAAAPLHPLPGPDHGGARRSRRRRQGRQHQAHRRVPQPARDARHGAGQAFRQRAQRLALPAPFAAPAPVAEELVLFNRGWYNRGGVEHVMGFRTKEQQEEFMQSVPKFEERPVGPGIKRLRYDLDASKEEQVKRLEAPAPTRSSSGNRSRSTWWQSKSGRRTPPYATPCWCECIRRRARANRARGQQAPGPAQPDRNILCRLHFAAEGDKLVRPDPDIVFEFSPDCLKAVRSAR